MEAPAFSQMSRFAFGTARLHHVPEPGQRTRLLQLALDLGLTHFDTAPLYGFGLAEAALGKALKGRRQAVTLATKIALYPPGPRQESYAGVVARKILGVLVRRLARPVRDNALGRAEASLSDSLRALKTDYVDYLFIHEPDLSSLEADDFHEWLLRMQRGGRIRHWGVAGSPIRCLPLIHSKHPVGNLVQTSCTEPGIDVLLASGCTPASVYGVLSQPSCRTVLGMSAALKSAESRFPSSTILVSASDPGRLREVICATTPER